MFFINILYEYNRTYFAGPPIEASEILELGIRYLTCCVAKHQETSSPCFDLFY